jgi:hypothetical protein
LGQKPNKQRSVEGRTLDAWRAFSESLYFLAGVLTVMPLLPKLPPMDPPWRLRDVDLEEDAKKLLAEGFGMWSEPVKASAGYIRRLRKHQEKIDRLVRKIEQAWKSGVTSK